MRPWRRIAARVEELQAERHRQFIDDHVAVLPACELHGWSPPSPKPLTENREALRSLCPYCAEERRRKQREEAAPETIVVDLFAGSVREQRAWDDALHKREEAGEVLPGSRLEVEALRYLDAARRVEVEDLRESADDRRRANAEHWGRRLGVSTRRQRYVPHPARAGK